MSSPRVYFAAELFVSSGVELDMRKLSALSYQLGAPRFAAES
jgi:hypothetical protein